MCGLKGRTLLLTIAILLLMLACVATFLVVWRQRGKGGRQVTGEIPGDALPRRVEADGQVAVKIAGDSFPLVFEKDDVPSALKRTIATDLGRALSYLDAARFEKLNRTRRLSRQNEDLEVTHRLVTKGSHPMILPKPLQQDFGEAVKSNGGYALVVRTTIIEEYVRAAGLKEEHPDMFAGLNEFIDLLNDQKRMKEISLDREACEHHVYRHGGVSMETVLEVVRGYASLDDLSVRHPSLLDIFPLSAFEAGASEDIYLVASLVEWKEDVGRVPVGAYADGKWCIFAFRMSY